MKQVIHMLQILLIAFVFSFTLTACSTKPPHEDITNDPATDAAVTKTPSIDTPTTDAGTEGEQVPTEQMEPGLMAVFYSIEDMRTFIQVSGGSEEEYMAGTPNPAVSHREARHISSYLVTHDLPMPTSEQTVEGFHATYYECRTEVVMVYMIDGIYYRFLIEYKAPEIPYDEPVAGTVALDEYGIEMHRVGEERYAGSVSHGTTTLTAVIYSGADVSELSLEAFDLRPLIPETE